MSDVEQYLSEQSKPQERLFWGGTYTVTPVIPCGQIGDGLQIISLTPLGTRPNYYIVRIDSKTDVDDDDFDTEEILELIEESFCSVDSCDDDGNHLEFPALDTESGYGWEVMKNFGTKVNNE